MLVFAGVVEVVHDLRQVLLGLVLPSHVGEFDAIGGFHVHLGIGVLAAEHHGVGAAELAHHPLAQQLPDAHKEQDGHQPAQQEGQDGGHLLLDLAGELRPRRLEPVDQVRVGHEAGLVDLLLVLVSEQDLIVLHLHLADLLLLGHSHEGAVVHLLHLPLAQPGHGQEVEQQQRQQDDAIVVDQRLLWFFHFIHRDSPLWDGSAMGT